MVRLSLSLLGPFRATLDGAPVTDWPSAKVRALLAYLAVESGHAHPREVLAGLLWPDYPERSAHTNLSNALSHLRTLLHEREAVSPCLTVDRETVQFDPESDCWVDVTAFLRRTEADPSAARSDAAADAAHQLEEAVGLYRGSFLEGFSLHDSPPFEQWALVTRERLQRQMMEALARLSAYDEQRGEYRQALAHARQQLDLEPWREGAHRQAMRALALSGQRDAALAQYEACVRALKEELDVEPAPETTGLYQAIREGRGPVRFPEPDRSVDRALPRAHNLPAQSTPFVGRERELDELSRLLADPQVRLVTVLGPGGSGKTRLALEAAARQVGRYEHGVWFASLATLQSVESIVPAVAQEVGFQFYPGGDPCQQLLDYLREKHVLLVLDNWEHLLEGANLVADLLAAAPRVQVLATSRARLNLQGEQGFHLEGMRVPAGEVATEDASQYSAVQLFLQSARRVRSDLRLEEELGPVMRLCRLVEGMPLALVLAAAWVEMLSPAEIAAEIERSLDFLAAEWRDLPERQRSVRAVFDHSWRLLSQQERALFPALAIFRGGFTREAAEQVAGADLRALVSLMNKSFLERDAGGRYQMHELLRQYGEEKLAQSPDGGQAARDRHAAYYAQLLYGQRHVWYDIPREAASEIDNARAALQWAVQSNRMAWIRELLYCLLHAHLSLWWLQEGRVLCQEAMQILRAGEPMGDTGIALAIALMGYARCSFLAGQPERLLELFQESQAILRRLGAQEELAWCNLWMALAEVYPFGRQDELLEESLAIGVRTSQQFLICQVLFVQAWNAMSCGAYEEAEQCGQRALQISREAGRLQGLGWSLVILGNVAHMTADYAKAGRYYQESLACVERTGEWQARNGLFNDLGDVALAQGEYEQARKHYGEALARSEGTCDYRSSSRALRGVGDVALASGDEVSARGYYQGALQVALEAADANVRAGALIGPATLLARRGDAKRAVEVLSLVLEVGPYPGTARSTADRLLDSLRSELSPAVFAAAQARGRARDVWTTAEELAAELQD